MTDQNRPNSVLPMFQQAGDKKRSRTMYESEKKASDEATQLNAHHVSQSNLFKPKKRQRVVKPKSHVYLVMERECALYRVCGVDVEELVDADVLGVFQTKKAANRYALKYCKKHGYNNETGNDQKENDDGLFDIKAFENEYYRLRPSLHAYHIYVEKRKMK